MSEKRIIVAIDGYSSSGKSTLAKSLASGVGYVYVDSGAMYRAVALYAMRHGMIDAGRNIDREALIGALPQIDIRFVVDTSGGRSRTCLNGEDVEDEIRSLPVSECVSLVAAIPEVRTALVDKQRRFGEDRGIVMDGRDIGTVVFPDAELKLFIDASPEVRARRRTKELQDKGVDVNYEDVLKNIEERDYMDVHRTDSPLRKADDAIVIDNDNMTLAQQDAVILEYFHKVNVRKW